MSIVSEMLENPNIKKWYKEMTYQGTEVTAEYYIRRLSRMLNIMKESPESLIKLEKNVLYDKMLEFATNEQEAGRTSSYILAQFKGIYSYLNHKDVDFKRIPNPKNSSSTPTVENETIPTKDELSRILDLASSRNKVSICLMAYSGLRPATISNLTGTDGLRMGDLSGWTITDGKIILENPTMITIRSCLSKTNRRYISFLCEEGVGYLTRYINNRIRTGEKITDNSPVVRNIYNGHHGHIGTITLTHGIKYTFKKAGIDKRPYVLRRYFASKLMDGEYKGDIPHSVSQFLMGHNGDMLSKYTTNKGLLDDQLISIRESYIKCQKYLQSDSSVSQNEIEATKERMDEIENKSKINEEMMFDRINKLEEENKHQKKIIDLLMKDKKETFKYLSQLTPESILENERTV